MVSLYEVLLFSLSKLMKFSVLMPAASRRTLFLLVQVTKPVFPYLFLISCFCIFFLVLKPCFLKPAAVYLVDFSCFKPPSYCRVPFSSFLENASKLECFDKESIGIMSKILISSGQSEETYLPPALHYIPPKTNQQESITEAQMVLFPVVEDLLAKTKLSPQDIDILIVTCSGFCPSPSLSSIVINKYSMRDDIKSYTLSGMGCSAGALAIDLAQNLLKNYKNVHALVLSTEILSTGWYPGHERPKLLLNCIFRMGSAAILLTNKQSAKDSSKYKLFCAVRTQRASDDKAYFGAYREEDSNGKLGVTVNRDILQAVGKTLRSHLSVLGSQILPFREKLRYGVSFIKNRMLYGSGEIYVPDFKTVIQHFCQPTSGLAAIREIGKRLKLNKRDMEAAIMTLHRFGNQSSSSLWYELSYIEAKERMKKGDKVWQLGWGTGLKCTSLVWECLRPIYGESQKGPWACCIHRYPVENIDQGIKKP